MQRDRHTKEVSGEGWVVGSTFFGSLMSGFFLGFGADFLFDTKPLWTVIGIIAGSGSGFYTMWHMLMKQQSDEE